MLDSSLLEQLFAECFRAEYQTVLVGGGTEPIYLPSDDPSMKPHRIIYREDYFASALHEVAHWCLAGARRRKFEDYGYWYTPDGRTEKEQEAFEKAEVEPQALEWILSDACGFAFNLSADNLTGASRDRDSNGPFERAVQKRRQRYMAEALPVRAEKFRASLLRVNPSLRPSQARE